MPRKKGSVLEKEWGKGWLELECRREGRFVRGKEGVDVDGIPEGKASILVSTGFAHSRGVEIGTCDFVTYQVTILGKVIRKPLDMGIFEYCFVRCSPLLYISSTTSW